MLTLVTLLRLLRLLTLLSLITLNSLFSLLDNPHMYYIYGCVVLFPTLSILRRSYSKRSRRAGSIKRSLARSHLLAPRPINWISLLGIKRQGMQKTNETFPFPPGVQKEGGRQRRTRTGTDCSADEFFHLYFNILWLQVLLLWLQVLILLLLPCYLFSCPIFTTAICFDELILTNVHFILAQMVHHTWSKG